MYRVGHPKQARTLVTMGHPMSVLKAENIFDRIISIKYDVPVSYTHLTSRTTDELVENLKDTEYYAPLKKLKDAQNVKIGRAHV